MTNSPAATIETVLELNLGLPTGFRGFLCLPLALQALLCKGYYAAHANHSRRQS